MTFKISIFFSLIRWKNLLIMALTQCLVLVFIIGRHQHFQETLSDQNFWKIVTSTLFIAAAGYIINDYFDVKIDIINKPEKVIVGRSIGRRRAIIIHQIFNIIGCLLGFWANKSVFIVNVFCVSLLWLYSAHFKQRPLIGNVVVAFLSGMALWVLGIYYQQNTKLMLLYSLFAFGVSLVREIIKDIEDIRGDMRHGCRTLPIVWGIRRTKVFLYGIILLFSILLFWAIFQFASPTMKFYFGLLVSMTGYLTFRLVWADKKRDFAFLSQFCKNLMLAGILSMVFIP